jgi:hypothetical protein
MLALGSAIADVKSERALNVTFHEISTKCHTPRGWLRLGTGGSIMFTPPPNANYARIMCVLGEVKRRKVPLPTAYINNGS